MISLSEKRNIVPVRFKSIGHFFPSNRTVWNSSTFLEIYRSPLQIQRQLDTTSSKAFPKCLQVQMILSGRVRTSRLTSTGPSIDIMIYGQYSRGGPFHSSLPSSPHLPSAPQPPLPERHPILSPQTAGGLRLGRAIVPSEA